MEPLEGRIVVRVDPEVKDIVPAFLEHRRHDVKTLREAGERADWETVRRLGHQLRGSGGGYGFDAITDIGHRLEDAARARDSGAIHKWTDELASYLGRVTVV